MYYQHYPALARALLLQRARASKRTDSTYNICPQAVNIYGETEQISAPSQPPQGRRGPPQKKTSSFSFDRTLWPSKHPSSRSPGTTGGRPFFIRQAALAKRGGQAMAGGSAPRLQRNRRGRKGCSLQGSPCYARSCSSTWASAGRKPSSRASAGVTQRRFWPSVGQGSPLKRLTWKKCRRTRKPRSA